MNVPHGHRRVSRTCTGFWLCTPCSPGEPCTFRVHMSTVLIKTHVPLHPRFPLEFVLLGFKVRYRSCSAQLYFEQNISYNKKNNFIKTRFPSQLCMILSKIHVELHFTDILTVSFTRLLVSAYVFFSRHGFFQRFLLASLPRVFVLVYIRFNQICHFSRIYFSTLTMTNFVHRLPHDLFVLFLSDVFILVKWLNSQFHFLCCFLLNLQFLLRRKCVIIICQPYTLKCFL